MVPLVVLTLLIHHVLCESDCTFSTIPHCSIKDGVADCSSTDLPGVVRSLPTCITAFHLSPRFAIKTRDVIFLDFCGTNFSRLVNVTDLSISVRRDAYYSVRLTQLNCPDVFAGLYLRRLSIQITYNRASTHYVAHDLLANIDSLQVLDFTRSSTPGVSYFTDLEGLPIRQLILKNCQDLRTLHYEGEVNLTALLCPLGGTLELADLSFNDIVILAMNFNSFLCMKNLQILDLSYNLLTSINFHQDGPNILNMLPLYSVGHLIANNQWYTVQQRTVDLWIDTKMERNTTKPIPLLTYIKMYINNVTDLCHVSYTKLIYCTLVNLPLDSNGMCGSMSCIVPKSTTFNRTLCIMANGVKRNVMIQNALHTMCDSDHCIYGIPLPFLPNLQTMDLRSFMGTSGVIFDAGMGNGTRGVCIYSENKLQYWDMSCSSFSSNKFNLQDVSHMFFYGFHELQNVNLSYMGLPTLHQNVTKDMPKLRHLDVSGNNLSMSGELPSDMFAGNPHLEVLDLSSMAISFVHPKAFQYNPKLSTVNLSNNYLNSQLFLNLSTTGLDVMILKNNNITTFSQAMREQLESKSKFSVDLSGNPLSCNCSNLQFIKWIQEQNKRLNFLSSSKYSCANSRLTYNIFTVDVGKLEEECQGNPVFITELVVGTSGGTLVVVLLFIMYRKRWIIRHFIFITKEKLRRITCGQQHEPVDNYEYDAFICYSNDDDVRIWVHLTLVPELEKKYGFKLCIHHRDFLGGRDIADNIEEAIIKSRKVIAIMCPGFIESRWCCREIQMTDSVDTRKIIFVKYRDIPPDMDIPRHVSLLMCERTYIEYQDDPAAHKLFWKRLCKAIYQK